MNRVCAGWFVAGLVLLFSEPLNAATSWDHVPVWPKSQQVRLLESPDNQNVVAEASEIEWPAIVEKTDGQWLKISDPGSYSSAPIEGWLRKDDILRLEAIQSFSTNKIRQGEAEKRSSAGRGSHALADAYWIRGIYWESQGDTESAVADLNQAIANGLRTGDVYLRLGRLQTQCAVKFEDHDLKGNAFICECADKSFDQAKNLFRQTRSGVPAQCYIAIGDAQTARYLASGDIKHAKKALDNYRLAEESNTSWSLPAYKQGKLRLLVLEQASKKDAKQLPDKPTLLLAIQDLTQAIRLNPNCMEAYQDRAEALRELTTAVAETPENIAMLDEGSEGARRDRPFALHLPAEPPATSVLAILELANASADRAYLLSNNRGARALEIKAKVEFAIAQELYKPHDPTLDLHRVARLDRAYSLFMDAIDLAKSAANHSESYSDIVDRFGMALNYYDKTNLVADDLANRGANKVAANSTKLKSQLEIAKTDLTMRRAAAMKLKATDPQRALLLADVDDAEKQVDEARDALDQISKNPELAKIAHGKINDAGKALLGLGKTTGKQGAEILDTVEIPSVQRPARPSYTPLNLDSK